MTCFLYKNTYYGTCIILVLCTIESMNRLTEYDVRKAKLKTLRELGIIPFAQQWSQNSHINTLKLIDQSSLRPIEDILSGPRPQVSLAGRLMLKRVSGKLSFAQLKDETGTLQLMFEHQHTKLLTLPNGQEKTLMGETTKSFDYRFVDKMLDVGDYIGVRGELFVTHKGELTLFVSEYQLLSKAIRPLGDKFHGIGEDNAETAYRQRYLDMIFNDESLERMKLRSQFIKTMREFYRSQGFMELDTPILGNSASGAAAAPFVTHHNDFDTDMYLRIAPEIALKMATVGGLEKIFEIGKNFRNEWSSPSHIQEFLVVEHYAAYRNYEHNMAFTEQLFNYLFDNIPQLKRTIQVADKNGEIKEVSFWQTWERIDYVKRIREDSGIDVGQYGPENEDELRALILSKGFHRVGIEKQGTATMIDYLYKKVTRPKIVGPAFIYNYPKTMQPLARTSDANPMIVEQFQAIVNGWEILKAYSELVDPVELQANFDAQGAALERGDDEATKGDDEFVLAMEYGMPPQSGRGMGIDRILAMLTEQANIRDVILFPLVKAEQTNTSESE